MHLLIYSYIHTRSLYTHGVCIYIYIHIYTYGPHPPPPPPQDPHRLCSDLSHQTRRLGPTSPCAESAVNSSANGFSVEQLLWSSHVYKLFTSNILHTRICPFHLGLAEAKFRELSLKFGFPRPKVLYCLKRLNTNLPATFRASELKASSGEQVLLGVSGTVRQFWRLKPNF